MLRTHAAFSGTGASWYLAGQLTAWALSGELPGAQPLPARAKQRQPDLPPSTPPSSPSSRGLKEARSLLPALSPPPPLFRPSPRCPPSHWWFLPAAEIQEAVPHVSSPHSFLQGLTHTRLGLIWSSLFSAPGEPQLCRSFLGVGAC